MSESSQARAVEIFRLRTVRGGGNSSSGDWPLYEDRDRFEQAALLALLEASGDLSHRTWSRTARSWLLNVAAVDTSDGKWHTQRVVAAEQLVDGQWVDLGAAVIEPRLEFQTDPSVSL